MSKFNINFTNGSYSQEKTEMKKIPFYGVWFFGTLIMLIGAELLLKSCTNSEVVPQEISPAKITSLEMEGHSDSLLLDYKQRIPVVMFEDSTESVEFQSKINELIQGYFDSFEEVAGDFGEEDDELESSYMSNNELQIDYNVFQNSTKLLSIRLNFYTYGIGAVHGNQSYEMLNYNRATKKFLDIEDIFATGSDYLKELSILSEAILISELGDEIFLEGISPDKENFSKFNVTDSSIFITFAPYHVSHYANGTQEIEISSKNLKNLKKDFVN